MGDRHIGVHLVSHDFNLAQDCERAREVALHEDVAKTEAAAIEPGRVIGDSNAERLKQGCYRRGALSSVDFRIVNRVLDNDLVVMTCRVHTSRNTMHVDNLPFGNTVSHNMDPLTVVDNLLRKNERFSELVQHAPDLVTQLLVMEELLTHLLIVAKAGPTVDEWVVPSLVGRRKVPAHHQCLGHCIGGPRRVVVPTGAGGLISGIEVVKTELAV